MASNWAIPREQVIDVAIAGLRRGWSASISEACASMTRSHYLGVSPSRAQVLLERDVAEVFFTQHLGRTEAQQEIAEMAKALRLEGWAFVPAIGRKRGGFWRHRETGVDVNQSGGSFSSYAEATRRTYKSATREWLLKHLQA